MVAIDARNAEALLSTLSICGHKHLTVNHKLNYVDPIMLASTNRVKSLWCRAKIRNQKECGTHRTLINTYLIEFMWREKLEITRMSYARE